MFNEVNMVKTAVTNISKKYMRLQWVNQGVNIILGELRISWGSKESHN